jgi:hypothetical protein
LLAEAEQLAIAVCGLVLVELPAAAEAGDDDHASTTGAHEAQKRAVGAMRRKSAFMPLEMRVLALRCV